MGAGIADGWYQQTESGLERVDRVSDITGDTVYQYYNNRVYEIMRIKREVVRVINVG